jgi:hypothetical protein
VIQPARIQPARIQPAGHHVAQLNVGRALDDMDSPRLAEFMSNLDRVNALAERSSGFVWRLTGDGTNNATDVKTTADPLFLVNMSVWETPEALEHFVWATIHKRFYDKKANWFEAPTRPHFVMWWVPIGHRPTAEEALERLQELRQHGSTDAAFGWEALPNIKLWMTKKCA